MWAQNGRELFYKSGNRMMVVDVETGAAFKAGTPRVLFEMPFIERGAGNPARVHRLTRHETFPGDDDRPRRRGDSWPVGAAVSGRA